MKLPVEKLGTPILTIARIGRPRGVAINQRGEVVVTELENHRIQVFSSSGEKIQSFGTRGSAKGEFHEYNMILPGVIEHPFFFTVYYRGLLVCFC